MANWKVEDRLTGMVVYAYGADAPDHFGTYPVEQYNHILERVVEVPVVREISGVAFLRRFTQAQRIAIRDLAKTNPAVDDFMRLLDATIAQGGMIDLDDKDTIGGVNYVAYLLPDATINSAEILG